MAVLTRIPYAVIDVETALPDENGVDGVCQVAIVRIDGQQRQQWAGLTNPGVPIRPEATAIHGITDADVAGCPPLSAVLETKAIRELLAGAQLTAFNAAFDGSYFPERFEWLCSYRLLCHLDRDQSEYSLEAAARRYGIPFDRPDGRHDAGVDAEAAATLTQHLVQQYLSAGNIDSVAALRQFANRPIRFDRLTFGRHAGARYEQAPPSYLNWLLHKSHFRHDPDIAYSIQSAIEHRHVQLQRTLASDAPATGRIESLRQRLALRAKTLSI